MRTTTGQERAAKVDIDTSTRSGPQGALSRVSERTIEEE